MALNVNRNVQDLYYRYKMPRLMAKVEGKGNGIKTVMPNMVEVAKALARPPTYCTKYFGCELGAQTQFDFKNDRYIVNGAHDANKLQDLLDGFIRKFVLCEKCENPETYYRVMVKRGMITSSCKACGHTFPLDMRHKLTTFILKNPPEQKINEQGTSLTKRKDKKSKGEGKDGGGNNEDGGGDDGDWAEDDAEDDDDWAEDMSEEAIKARRNQELSAGISNLTMNDDLEKPEGERINIFHDYVKARLDKITDMATEKDIFREAERLEVSAKAPIVLCELLFDEAMVSQIKKNKRLFLRFTQARRADDQKSTNQKTQKYLLGGVEKSIEAKKAALLPKVAAVFKAFYDEDIVDEEVFTDWAKKVSKKYVSKDLSEQIHKKAEPFITWLQEAEEETSDEDSDVELEFDERAKVSSLKEVKDVSPVKANGNGKAAAVEEEEDDGEDDVDIDDI